MQSGIILSNVNLSGDYYKVVFYAPEICPAAMPGNFVHVKIANMEEHILRRPFSICSASPASGELEVIYKVVGAGTRVLSTLVPGTLCDLLGPLGRPYTLPARDEFPVAVAGGYGAAAMYMLTRHSPNGGVLLLGARTQDDILLEDAYRTAGFEVKIATDDGSLGYKGRVTELVPAVIAEHKGKKLRFYGCGPGPMLMALAKILNAAGYGDSEVSLDHLMCCGVGACFACVVKLRDPSNPDGFRYARTCSEGPVFKASDIYMEAE